VLKKKESSESPDICIDSAFQTLTALVIFGTCNDVRSTFVYFFYIITFVSSCQILLSVQLLNRLMYIAQVGCTN